LKPGDILIVRVGANRGDCCVVPQGTGEINCANIVFARPWFPTGSLGSVFGEASDKKLLLSGTTGSAQGVINTGTIAQMRVPVPPLAIRERIASILSGLRRPHREQHETHQDPRRHGPNDLSGMVRELSISMARHSENG